MKTFFLTLFTAVLAFGQVRLDPNEAARLWSEAESLSASLPVKNLTRSAATTLPAPNLPSLRGAAIVVEPELNGGGRRAHLVTKTSGSYLFQGISCHEERVRLGEVGWQQTISSISVAIPIFDSTAMYHAAPFMTTICHLEIFQFGTGAVTRTVVRVEPWMPTSDSVMNVTPMNITSESIGPNGRYYLYLSGTLEKDTTAALGRWAMAEDVRPHLSGGSVIVFPPGIGLPSIGPTTLTICARGTCNTLVYERRISSPPSLGGKG